MRKEAHLAIYVAQPPLHVPQPAPGLQHQAGPDASMHARHA